MIPSRSTMFAYQKTGRFFAQVSDGLDDLVREELARLGAKDSKPAYRGVWFGAGMDALFRVNYRSRLLTRVLAPLITFDCHSADYLYKTGRSIDWPSIFTAETTFAIDASTANSKITHSRYAAQRLKDAIVDLFREEKGARPSVDRKAPDLRLHLRIHANRATISIDTSGASLHRRGYRREGVEAPMQETLAAAIVRLSEWDGGAPLLDPMCGSGTLLMEALMAGSRIPSGFLRPRFGFEFLPDYDETIWRKVRDDSDGRIRELPEGLVAGSDASPDALAAAKANRGALPGGEKIRLRKARFQDLDGIEDGVILCNPPYGIRSGRDADLGRMTGEFGDFLKQRCRGSRAFVYFGERELIKKVGLRTAWKKPLRNGGLDGRLVKFELY